MKPTQNNLALALSQKTADAYSYDVYRSWNSVARALLGRGYSMREVETIMRSKWMRWAADSWKGGSSENVPARAILEYIDKDIARRGADRVARDLAEMVIDTLGAE